MKITVNPHKCSIDRSLVNEKEINVTKCEFEFSNEIPRNYVKEAYFTYNGTTYKQILFNNECDFPPEVLEKKGQVEIGVVAYEVQEEEYIKRFNPSPAYFETWQGSLKDEFENSEEITPTDKEQIIGALNDGLDRIDSAIENVNTAIEEANNLDLDVSKEGKVATVTLTKKDASTKVVNINDGVSLQFMWNGTSLGIKTDDMQDYVFVDLQGRVGPMGPKGEAFQIKKTYATIDLMIADYDNMEINDYVMISGNIEEEDNAKLFVKTETVDPVYKWQYLADFSGASGVVGPQGASVTSATINNNGELILNVE